MKKGILIATLSSLVTLGLVGLGLFLLAQTGAVNVAASQKGVPGVEAFLGTLQHRSIERQARRALDAGRIVPPQEITDAMLRSGSRHFAQMCVPCHGGPGVEAGEVGRGLSPEPPELSHAAEDMTLGELYWVLEHGIRHTGMPSFGETHTDADLWAIAGFVERLDGMSSEEFRRWTASRDDDAGGLEDSPAEHSHEGDEHASTGS